MKHCSKIVSDDSQTARELKLKNLPECFHMSGGAAIEHIAKAGNPKAFGNKHVMSQIPICNFSFA